MSIPLNQEHDVVERQGFRFREGIKGATLPLPFQCDRSMMPMPICRDSDIPNESSTIRHRIRIPSRTHLASFENWLEVRDKRQPQARAAGYQAYHLPEFSYRSALPYRKLLHKAFAPLTECLLRLPTMTVCQGTSSATGQAVRMTGLLCDFMMVFFMMPTILFSQARVAKPSIILDSLIKPECLG